MENKIEFIKGLYPKKLPPNAPEFVMGRGSIKCQDMIEYLQEKLAQGEEWVNYDVLLPKDKSKDPYAKLNDWKPEHKEERGPVGQSVDNMMESKDTIDISDVPF